MNFVTILLHNTIYEHDIYFEQSLPYEVEINLVCKLLKVFYRLKLFPLIEY